MILNNGLVGGTFYKFKVKAVNNVGESPFSPAFMFVAADKPDAPTVPLKVTSTTTTIDLAWTAPASNGTPILGYTVFSNVNSGPYS